MNNGWIKWHRAILDWEWFTDSNMVHLFMYLVISANHEPKKWMGITIDRGQLVTGRSSISLATGISERSIRTCLARLESTKEIVVKTTNKYSLITICKYDNYQCVDCDDDQQTTNKRPTTDQQTTTNKNDKNIRTKEEYTLFDEFWIAYHDATKKPKEDKEGAKKYWKKLTKEEKQKAIDMIMPYSKTTETKYLKMARRYLENKSFNNEFGSGYSKFNANTIQL